MDQYDWVMNIPEKRLFTYSVAMIFWVNSSLEGKIIFEYQIKHWSIHLMTSEYFYRLYCALLKLTTFMITFTFVSTFIHVLYKHQTPLGQYGNWQGAEFFVFIGVKKAFGF